LHCNGHEWDFWFRNQCVAKVLPQEEVIYFTNFEFLQELLEVNQSQRLISFARELAKPVMKIVPEFIEDPDEPEDEDDVIREVVNDPRERPLYVIADEESAEWVAGQLMNVVEKHVEDQANGALGPSLKHIGTVIYERWNGVTGAGKVLIHYSMAGDVDRWLNLPDKYKRLFRGTVFCGDKVYQVGMFHSHGAHQPVGKKDDLYVIYQRVGA
jgi:hypothetical protein